MKVLKDIIKGIIIGIANIMPGISGGTLAIAMGIYEKLIYAITNIFKKPIECIKLVWAYGVGILIGIAGSIFGIVYLFNIAPIPTSMLFIGLIIGSLPIIKDELKSDKINLKDYMIFIITTSLILFMPLLSPASEVSISLSIKDTISLFIVGLLAATTLVIPGISGSMLLMALGYYSNLLEIISGIMKDLLLFNFTAAFNNMLIILPFGLGMIIGIFLTAKIIQVLFDKHHNATYWGIIGLIVASPFPIIVNLDIYNISLSQIAISIILFVSGLYITTLLSKKEKGEDNEKNS